MKHFIIGTAGHVDHGKTTLVKAMTGIDTDRLKEEKERGISIELGFAPLQLPSGTLAGIVDVPGHERFIRHMLAGVAGIDLVLFVVAADEGVMPQTREHLDIIQLLQIQKGIIVITKIDLVEADWLTLVEEEITSAVCGTVLEQAPLIRVSGTTGEGIDTLIGMIDEMALEVRAKTTTGPARLSVDRAFTKVGFGPVVTGTLAAGKFKLLETVEILPRKVTAKIRTLQVHGQKVEEAFAGQRVAVNLAGIELEQVHRGDVLATPGSLGSSYRIDVRLEMLPGAEKPLKNNTRVRFNLGTKETFGRVLLLDREEIEPGEKAYAHLVMEEPVVAAKDDRFVIRSYSPVITIAGGAVIDPAPPRQKRYRQESLRAIETKEKGTPEQLLLQQLEAAAVIALTPAELQKAAGLEEAETLAAIEKLVNTDQVVAISAEGKEYLIAAARYQQLSAEIVSLIAAYHRDYPLRPGLSKEELRSRKFPQQNARLFNAFLQAMERDGLVRVDGQVVSSPGFTVRLDDKLERAWAAMETQLREDGFQPTEWSQLVQRFDIPPEQADELLNFLLWNKMLIKIEGFYLLPELVAEGKQKIVAWLEAHQSIQIAEARDLLQSSRRFVLPFLEYLDREKVTRREGDKRIKP